jgi:predicted  nucleic acid-binding Zn-ribbon protein
MCDASFQVDQKPRGTYATAGTKHGKSKDSSSRVLTEFRRGSVERPPQRLPAEPVTAKMIVEPVRAQERRNRASASASGERESEGRKVLGNAPRNVDKTTRSCNGSSAQEDGIKSVSVTRSTKLEINLGTRIQQRRRVGSAVRG